METEWATVLTTVVGLLLVARGLESLLSVMGWIDSAAPEVPVGKERYGVLLVTAHPDDEAMFFLPTIRAFQRSGFCVHLCCLSDGGGGGDAKVRLQELQREIEVLQLNPAEPRSRAPFEDGMKIEWDADAVAQELAAWIAPRAHHIAHVVTFDEEGVSGHLNHISVFRGVELLRRRWEHYIFRPHAANVSSVVPEASPTLPPRPHSPSTPQPTSWLQTVYNELSGVLGPGPGAQRPEDRPAFWTLSSVNLLRKYAGVFDAIFTASEKQSKLDLALPRRWVFRSPESVSVSYSAMSVHASQFVWFRRLFVLFSRYTYFNTLLERID